MSFFEARDGDYYPTSGIDFLSPSGKSHSGKKVPARAFMKDRGHDEGGIAIADDAIDHIMKLSQPCMPATPGYFVLSWSPPRDDQPAFIWSQPVIGWRVNEFGTVDPLVFETDWTGFGDRHGLLYPTGQVGDLYGATYDKQSDWEAEQAERYEDDQKRAALTAEAKRIADEAIGNDPR